MNWKLLISLIINACLILGYVFCLPKKPFESSLSTVLLDRDERLLSARIAEDGQWRFPVRDSIPEKFEKALICFEDRHFYEHSGVHLPSLFRALIQNLRSGKRVSGGSTLSMQTVRLMRGNPPRTYFEKLYEIILATRLEWSYSKDEILQFWAGNAPFGGNVVGIDAASWRYFGRDAEDLSWAESATLAVLPNAPSLIFPGKNQERLIEKRNRLLLAMMNEGLLDSVSCELAMEEPVPGAPKKLPQLAFHLMQTLEQEHGSGQLFKSTIDRELQKRVAEIGEIHAKELAKNRVYNLCALITRVEDGAVVAYLGNVKGDELNPASYVDIVQAPRSTGSILKPLLFAGMLSDGELLPNMLITDTPVRMGSFAPKNYSETYDGVVPAARALSRSLNIPAVHLLENYGVERFHQLLQSLNFKHINHGPSHYGLSLILGGAEASLWEVNRAYTGMSRALSQFGTRSARYAKDDFACLHTLQMEKEKPELSSYGLLSASSVYQTYDALQKVNRPGNEEGWEMFSSSIPMAWKTGTSYGFRDAWSVGCTPNYVISVWVGNAGGEGRPGLTGVGAAAPVLFDLADLLPSASWFPIPYDDMREIQVCTVSGYPAGAHCPETEILLAPNAAEKVKACSFHRLIHLDKKSGLRADASCVLLSELVDSSWFELNPVQAWFYRKKHSNYHPIPNWDPRCEQTMDQRTIQFIYPLSGQKIYLPIQLDTQRGQVVFEAAHQDLNSTLFWHLDQEYLGATRELHSMALEPTVGKHSILVLDEKGQRMEMPFEILKKEE